MRKEHTESKINSASEKDKFSHLSQEDIQELVLNYTQPYHRRSFPGYIAADPNLKDSHRVLYGLIDALTSERGYCYAQNDYLAKHSLSSVRSVQRRLEHLEKCGWIKVEVSQQISHKSSRKIWLNELIAQRQYIEKHLGKTEFNQRFYRDDRNVMSSCQKCHTDAKSNNKNIRNSSSICAARTSPRKPARTSPSKPPSASLLPSSSKKIEGKHKLKKPDKPKPSHELSSKELVLLNTRWGSSLVSAKSDNFLNTMRKFPKAYEDRSMFEVVDEWCHLHPTYRQVKEENEKKEVEKIKKAQDNNRNYNLKSLEEMKKKSEYLNKNLVIDRDWIWLRDKKGSGYPLFELGLIRVS